MPEEFILHHAHTDVVIWEDVPHLHVADDQRRSRARCMAGVLDHDKDLAQQQSLCGSRSSLEVWFDGLLNLRTRCPALLAPGPRPYQDLGSIKARDHQVLDVLPSTAHATSTTGMRRY